MKGVAHFVPIQNEIAKINIHYPDIGNRFPGLGTISLAQRDDTQLIPSDFSAIWSHENYWFSVTCACNLRPPGKTGVHGSPLHSAHGWPTHTTISQARPEPASSDLPCPPTTFNVVVVNVHLISITLPASRALNHRVREPRFVCGSSSAPPH
jgi:hypothetical protein